MTERQGKTPKPRVDNPQPIDAGTAARWARKDAWTPAEVASLCCGYAPDTPRPENVSALYNEALDAVYRAIDVGRLDAVSRPSATPGDKVFDTACLLAPHQVIHWALAAFPESFVAFSPRMAAPQTMEKDLHHGHRTKLLQALDEAVVQFWSTYDPDDPSTAPRNKDVEAWLKSKRELSDRQGKAIAMIIRADDVSPGPRPKKE